MPKNNSGSAKPVFFPTQFDFRNWLLENHRNATELLIGFYKVGSGKQSISWSQSVDEAICFGWIDGVRKSIDSQSYCIRFTPRKPKSNWSAINIKKAEDLTRKGLMQPAGISIFAKREENKSRIYSYEKEKAVLSNDYLKKLMTNKKAWKYFHSLAPSYQNTVIHWIMSAKQETTRVKRLEELVRDSEAGRKIIPS